VVGRETELAQLHTLLEKALNGQRQVVFVTGEPGIGKTTLVKHFLSQLADVPHALLALGECIEHHGLGEPYQPILEAVERLCRQPKSDPLVSRLRQYAPLWLAQMPALLNPKQRTALQKEMRGASHKRMQREFANFVESLTVTTNALEAPLLVLCVEDLH
jgi:Cdc6-like AAA superfamily ATPase